jgi:hypothetical protein
LHGIDIVTEPGGERAQYTARGVGEIVVAATAVINGIPAAAMSMAFEQSQFSQQPGMIGQAH